ncbi:unnamed protein product, partial [Prorocentrum cordatum]
AVVRKRAVSFHFDGDDEDTRTPTSADDAADAEVADADLGGRAAVAEVQKPALRSRHTAHGPMVARSFYGTVEEVMAELRAERERTTQAAQAGSMLVERNAALESQIQQLQEQLHEAQQHAAEVASVNSPGGRREIRTMPSRTDTARPRAWRPTTRQSGSSRRPGARRPSPWRTASTRRSTNCRRRGTSATSSGAIATGSSGNGNACARSTSRPCTTCRRSCTWPRSRRRRGSRPGGRPTRSPRRGPGPPAPPARPAWSGPRRTRKRSIPRQTAPRSTVQRALEALHIKNRQLEEDLRQEARRSADALVQLQARDETLRKVQAEHEELLRMLEEAREVKSKPGRSFMPRFSMKSTASTNNLGHSMYAATMRGSPDDWDHRRSISSEASEQHSKDVAGFEIEAPPHQQAMQAQPAGGAGRSELLLDVPCYCCRMVLMRPGSSLGRPLL